jgi:Right handed beta helix region
MDRRHLGVERGGIFMALDIRDFASFAIGEDFQPAFRAALDSLIAQGGGELVIPKPASTDTYWIGRRERDSGIAFTGVNVPIKIRGEGRTPRIGMLPSVDAAGSPVPTKDFSMFDFRETYGSISLEDLCLFGNKDAFPPKQNEQTHLVQIRNARDISFTNVWFEESWSDGIKIVGDLGDEEIFASDRIQVMGCHFLHNGRDNILFQRVARRVLITNNYFDGGFDSQIHFEPSGGLGIGAPEEIVIAYNHIRNRHFDKTTGLWVPHERAAGITLANGHKVTVIGNHIEGGTIYGQNVQEAAIIGNHIDGGACLLGGIQIFRAVRDVSIIGNWVRTNATEPAVALLFNDGAAPENVIVANNPHLEGRTGVNVTGGRRIKIHDNLIFENSHGATGVGVNIAATVEEIDHVSVHDNYIKGFMFGVQLAASNAPIKHARIRSNDSEGAVEGAFRQTGTHEIDVEHVP